MQEVEMLSERNSKHLFIECCQALPGYECTLYPVRVPQGARFRKEAKQILGVSSKKVVFLDEKTKARTSCIHVYTYYIPGFRLSQLSCPGS